MSSNPLEREAAAGATMNKPELSSRIVEYRCPGWLAEVIIVGLVLKFFTG